MPDIGAWRSLWKRRKRNQKSHWFSLFVKNHNKFCVILGQRVDEFISSEWISWDGNVNYWASRQHHKRPVMAIIYHLYHLGFLPGLKNTLPVKIGRFPLSLLVVFSRKGMDNFFHVDYAPESQTWPLVSISNFWSLLVYPFTPTF